MWVDIEVSLLANTMDKRVIGLQDAVRDIAERMKAEAGCEKLITMSRIP